MLTGKEIIRRSEIGDIVIDPFDKNKVNPNSYNLTLNENLLVYDSMSEYDVVILSKYNDSDEEEKKKIIEKYPETFNRKLMDMKKNNPTLQYIIPECGFVLMPNKLYLAKTNEYTETHNLVPALSGRSSIGRLGINVHATAGFGDVGFKGNWTLEIFVVEPVVIYPNIEICQIYYYEPVGELEQYVGRYQNSHDVHSSRLFKDYE